MPRSEGRLASSENDDRSVSEEWLRAVAAAAAEDSRAPVELLGEYLPVLARAALGGRRPDAWDLDAVRDLGRQAATQGVSARRAVALYLSAAWRLWRELPVALRSAEPDQVRDAAEAVLRVVDDAVGVLVDGHSSERRDMTRHEEALRRAFIDDLLRGDADVSAMVERAQPFGIDLGKPHHVALVALPDAGPAIDRSAVVLERAVVDRFGDRDVLVATKDGRIVVVVPAAPIPGAPAGDDVAPAIHEQVVRLELGPRRRVAAGRAYPGAYGVARSYEEAREALVFAERLRLDAEVVGTRDLLVHRVLGRDQTAIVDLVRAVLAPLDVVRGGADVLLDTLQAYFDAGDVATEAARRLGVSVRTVTYRLARIDQLSGYSAARPAQRFALHAAVLGARLLDWPARPLPMEP